MTDENELKPIGGYPNYAVNKDGEIFNKHKKKLKPQRNSKGYLRVNLYNDKGMKTKSVHSIVLSTFIGRRPDGYICRHLDGDKENNALKNLTWGTYAENERDKKIHNTVQYGEDHPKSVLKIDQAKTILERYVPYCRENGIAPLSRELGVSTHCVRMVVTGKTWVEALAKCDELTKEKD